MFPIIPEVSEAEASGEVAAIFAEIRALSGAPLVNLVYRHLATEPEVLAWVWSQLRPRLLSGELPMRAAVLQDELRSVLRGCGQTLAVPAAVPLDEVLNVLRNYNRGNSTNLLALAGLPGLPLELSTAPLEKSLILRERELMPLQPMPPLPPLAALDAAMARQVARLNRMGEPGQPAVLASLYRHLSLWPPVLDAMESLLLPLQQSGKLSQLRRQTWGLARALSDDVGKIPSAPAPLVFQRKYAGFLADLAQVTIAKMVPIGLLMEQALAGR